MDFPNIYERPQERTPNETIVALLQNKNVRIEKIVSDAHVSDWYDQDEDEWVCLLTGEADIQFTDKTKTLLPGDTLYLPRHTLHRVSRTTKCIWLCVFIAD